MAEPVIFEGQADFESIVAGFDEILAAAEAASEAVAQFGTAAGDLSGFDEILSAIQAQTDAVTAGFEQLDASLTGIADLADTSAVALQSLDTTLSEMAAAGVEAAAGADEAAAGLDRIAPAAEEAGGALDGLRGMQGPLMMIGTLATVAGAKVLDMGLQGQKGEALLSGMAGASQQDIAALQQEALKLGVTMDQASAGFYEVESAGYSGAGAIKVFDAAMKLAEGGQAQAQDVMTGLTAIMHDYGLGADQATYVTDRMREAVFLGKQQMQDFATSIGPLAAAAHNAGVSMDEMLSAESTMTQVNPHVRQDTMQLAALFQSLSPTMGKTAETAKSLGLSFNEAHYASLDLIGRLEYLAGIAGGDNTAAFVKLTGGVRGSTAAIDILTGKGQTYIDDMKKMGDATGATEQTFADWERTIPAHLDHVSAATSVFSTRMQDDLGPRINPLLDHLTSAIPEIGTLVEQAAGRLLDFANWLGQVYTQMSENGALQEFGSIMSDIGDTVHNVATAALELLGATLNETGTQAQGVGDAFKKVADVLKTVSSLLAWLTSQFTDTGVKGEILRGVLLTVADAFAAIKVFQLAQGIAGLVTTTIPGLITGLGETTVAIGGMELALGPLSLAIGAIGFVIAGTTYAFTHWSDIIKQNDQAVGTHLKDYQAAGQGINAQTENIGGFFQRLGSGVQTTFESMHIGTLGSLSAMVSDTQNHTQKMADDAKKNADQMQQNVSTEVDLMKAHAFDAFRGIQDKGGQSFDQLLSQVDLDASQMDTNAKGYWDDVMNYIENNPIMGRISYSAIGAGIQTSATNKAYAAGTDYAAGGLSLIGELGPELMYIPQGAQILPNSMLESIQALTSALPSLSGGLFGGGGGSNSQVIGILAQILTALQRSGKPTGPQVPPTATMYTNANLYGITNIQDVMNSLNALNGYTFEQGGRGML
jgi:TP901 family phage tail tape measure protein